MTPLLRDAGLLLLAWVLGGAIGWQRESEGRSAGLRTHVLVCGASCLLSLLSFSTTGGGGDTGRVAAQIVSGIGFLGAGVILRRGLSVRGLTTAATIWLVAAVGIAVGAGGRFAALASLATILTLLTLTQVRRLEKRLQKSSREANLLITLDRHQGAVGRLMEMLSDHGVMVLAFDDEETSAEDAKRRTLRLQVRFGPDAGRDAIGTAITEAMPQAHYEWEE